MENVSKLESLDTNTLKLILKNTLDDKREKIQGDFLTFVKTVWPEFVEGKHHKIYAEKLNRIANGELKRLIVNMPPFKQRIQGNWQFALDEKRRT